MEAEKWALLREELEQRYLTARDQLLECKAEDLIDTRAKFRALHQCLVLMTEVEGALTAVDMPITASEETVERHSREGDGHGRKRHPYRNAGY